jgi:two-component sensor histidine kinase
MLAMQAQRESKEVQEIIQISKKRIDSIAMVHSMLYVSDNIEKVNIKAFLEKLSKNLKSTSLKKVEIKLKIQELELTLNEVIPIGLIINELLTNSFKYAFENTLKPKIIIVFTSYKKNATLVYHDNGSGYTTEKADNMGLKLVELNVKQLKGTIKIKNKNGLGYKIKYKRSLHV